MKPLYSYIDYRAYLRDLYEHKKLTTYHFSYRYLSKKAGFSSPVFIKLVIDGKRNLSNDSILKISTALNLSQSEAIYFKNLVHFNQATNAAAKSEHYAVLLSMMNNVEEQHLARDQYEYLSKWYHPVMREIVCSVPRSADFSHIASLVSPAITETEAKESIALLERLELIQKQDDGTYLRTNTSVTTDAKTSPLAIRDFNGSMIAMAKQAIDAFDPQERYISGVTCGVSKECMDVLRAEIQAFKDRMVSIINRDTGCDRVYQLNIQFFPLSENLSSTSKTTGDNE